MGDSRITLSLTEQWLVALRIIMFPSPFNSTLLDALLPYHNPTMTDNHTLRKDGTLEAICELMTARVVGRADDDAIEAAVARVIPSVASAALPQEQQDLGRTQSNPDEEQDVSDNNEEEEEEEDDDSEAPEIDEDMEDYDDDELDEDVVPKRKVGRPRKSTQIESGTSPINGQKRKKNSKNFSKPKKKRKAPKNRDWSAYKSIPFGKQGAQMLGTFGDSREPLVETVEAALESTKQLVKAAVSDAKKIRMEFLNNLLSAQRTMRKHKQEKPENKGDWSAEIMYRAMTRKSRNDNIDRESFTVEELKTLYPEEMNVYDRWRLLREHAERSKQGEDAAKVEDDEEDEEEIIAKEKQMEDAPAVGRLTERSEQFDRRTVRMKQKRYLDFALIRRGSFLGRAGIDVDQAKGQPGPWAKLAPEYLRFLLWCGFDPQSSELPPEPSTIEALAFLAYNFLGRVVETAVRLRNEKQKRKIGVVEIPKGDMLQVVDIENAMKDADVKPSPIFESPAVGTVGTQLYFGPGFENRLEIELEEMVKAARQLGGQKERAPDDLFVQLDLGHKDDSGDASEHTGA